MAIVDDYLEVRPDARPRIAALAEEGRLSLGPWYVLADELLAGDEPLVRNLMLGRRRAAELGGRLAVGYSPDAFGHPACLPSILRGFGIRYAVLWRGYGGEAGQERDLFRWKAPDGSEVLTYHLPAAGYEYGANLPASPGAAARRWAELRRMLEPRSAGADALLVMNGADHHSLQPDLVEAVAALRSAEPEYEVEIGTLERYFELAGRREGGTAGENGHPAIPLSRYPAISGELRWSYRYTWTLQGVHATRSSLKRSIAEGAALLTRWAEPQAALAAANSGADRRALLAAAWRAHLLNLSHDVLAGSVADPVADDAALRARHVAQQARGLLDDALMDRLGQDATRSRRARERWSPAMVVVNPSPAPRGGIVEATVTLFRDHVVVGRPAAGSPPRVGDALPAFHLLAPDGNAVPLQVLGAARAHERLDSARDYPDQDEVWAVRVAVRVDRVPAFGCVRLDLRAGLLPEGPKNPGPAPAVSPGADSGRQPGVDLISEPDEGDTYTFQPTGRGALKARWEKPRVLWRGPLVAAVAHPFQIGGRVRGTLFVRTDAGSSLVRYVIEGENLAGNHRLRIVFPVQAGEATADMPYGPVTRALVTFNPKEFPREWPATTAPMHRYVSAGGRTVLARGLHEYEPLADGGLAVTLLRAVGDLSRGHLTARPGHAGWPTPTPGAQELGAFRAELAVAPVAAREGDGAPAWDAVERAAEEFHAPLAGRMLRWGIAVPDAIAGPELIGEGLAFKALKPRDDGPGVVLRCVNLTDGVREGAWRWPGKVTRAFRAKLDETVLGELTLDRDRREIRFLAAPREIVTLIVET
jgi:alpha-mannosidase